MLAIRIRNGFSADMSQFKSHKICQNLNFNMQVTVFNRYQQDHSNELGFNVVQWDLDGLLR